MPLTVKTNEGVGKIVGKRDRALALEGGGGEDLLQLQRDYFAEKRRKKSKVLSEGNERRNPTTTRSISVRR